MTQHSYSLNASNARAMGNAGKIQTTGAYIGTFTRAEAVTSNQGTLGIEFDFKSEDGATCSFIQVWTVNKAGEELGGRKVIDALMTCLRVREIHPQPVKCDKWDSQKREVTKQTLQCFPELMGKRVGIVLQKEHSTWDGKPRTRMQLYNAFEASSRKIAKEILDNLPATILDVMLANLSDKFEKGNKQSQQRPSSAQQEMPGYMDDEIPF